MALIEQNPYEIFYNLNGFSLDLGLALSIKAWYSILTSRKACPLPLAQVGRRQLLSLASLTRA
jgi:hypothetical protein